MPTFLLTGLSVLLGVQRYTRCLNEKGFITKCIALVILEGAALLGHKGARVGTTFWKETKQSEWNDMSSERNNRSKVVVVVHGMGEQRQFETSKTVASRLCEAAYWPSEHPTDKDHHCYSKPSIKNLSKLGVSRELLQYRCVKNVSFQPAVHEVHWANLSTDYHRPNIFTFFRNAQFRAAKIPGSSWWLRTSYSLAINLINVFLLIPWFFNLFLKIIWMIPVFRWFVIRITGKNTPNISSLYEAYLGDVELYSRGDVDDLEYELGGFDHVYHHVNKRFDTTMSRLGQSFDEIYLIAHSLGSVLSINRVINAALQDSGAKKAWLKKLKLVITFGSPLDKFVALYRATLVPIFIPRIRFLKEPIPWVNITAYWDPVGGKLDDLFYEVQWLKHFLKPPIESLLFGTIRSWFPGLAHRDYFKDKKLWKKILDSIQSPDEANAFPRVVGEGKDRYKFIKWSALILTLALFLVSIPGVWFLSSHIINLYHYGGTSVALVLWVFLLSIVVASFVLLLVSSILEVFQVFAVRRQYKR